MATKQADDNDENDCVQYKLVVLGNGAVGKTSLCTRFAEDKFARSYKQTIGVDFFLKQLVLPDGSKAAVQLWDIGGQTIASKMVANYIFGAHAILLVYDITNLQSFQDLEDWMDIVERVYTSNMPYLALLANKADLTHMRLVTPSQHVDFADTLSMHSFFVSAKTGDNVATALYRMVGDLSGVPLSAADLSHAVKVVPAQVINHTQSSTEETDPEALVVKTKHRCTVM